MISILLATYNGEKYISLAIESVLNQSFKDFELLIGFNGTTDSSKGIVYRYNDPRIRVFDFGDDKGKSKTLNKLLIESRYDHVCLQDDDDVWVYNKLEKQTNYFEEYDVVGTLISDFQKKPTTIVSSLKSQFCSSATSLQSAASTFLYL
jgi:glycosyltransferase involved in cell wall biosynthesis